MTQEKRFSRPVAGKSMPFLVYTPEEYDDQPDKRWPLVIFLHGAGERGTDLKAVRRHGPLREVERGRAFPFLIAAPQLSGQEYWGGYIESLNAWLDDLLAEYRIDPDRVYLTGLSMGGTGTWLWAMASAGRFAAIMPMCGTGICWCAGNVAGLPIWTFHGSADEIIPVEESIHMVNRVNASGGNAKLTIMEGYTHDCWTDTYAREDVYEWLLEHRREE
ncbi:MAG: phospholipase [Acutalibacteraceae bacterium]|jgi:predicted peptidase